MVKNLILFIGCALLMSSCNSLDIKGVIIRTSDDVNKRFEQSMNINKTSDSDVVNIDSDYMFYVCTDPHIDKTSKSLTRFYDSLCNDNDASFGVILGDCTDVCDNLPAYLKALQYSESRHTFNYPIFHVLGNHDIFFNGWLDYKELVGPSVYWFETSFSTGKDLYVVLDTANGTLGQKQTNWFHSFLSEKRADYRHCFILTHTNFFYTDMSQASTGNMPMDESVALVDFLGKQKVTLVLQGHDHYSEDLVFNNVRYTIVGAISDKMKAPEYLKVYVTEDGICYEWVKID